jgi:hypothetical protein
MRSVLKTVGLHRILLFSFWYFALFPGRLGFDYSLLARMVQTGEETAWWGANYYWIFRFLTFEGTTIFLLSLVGLVLLTFSLYFFIWSLPIKKVYQLRSMTFVMATPLYGFFGVTVSHDVFQTCGILLISALLLRLKFDSAFKFSKYISVLSILIVCLLTVHTGIIIILYLLIVLFIHKERGLAVFAIMLTTLIYLFSNLTIQEPSKYSEFFSGTADSNKEFLVRTMLIDLKCIVQHPMAIVTNEEWEVLESISSKENWLKQTTCSSPDAMAEPLMLEKNDYVLDKELIFTFFSVVSRSPALLFVSHIQRSSVALPPPFFLPPSNQIPWDPGIPLGTGTNVALQSGPEVLHPSIDEPTLAKKISYLAPLEAVAQTAALIINQASWFWGWGGLWLWAIYIFLTLRMRVNNFKDCVILTAPTIILHLSIFAIGPSSLPRYVMATVFQGIIFTYLLIFGRKAGLQ